MDIDAIYQMKLPIEIRRKIALSRYNMIELYFEVTEYRQYHHPETNLFIEDIVQYIARGWGGSGSTLQAMVGSAYLTKYGTQMDEDGTYVFDMFNAVHTLIAGYNDEDLGGERADIVAFLYQCATKQSTVLYRLATDLLEYVFQLYQLDDGTIRDRVAQIYLAENDSASTLYTEDNLDGIRSQIENIADLLKANQVGVTPAGARDRMSRRAHKLFNSIDRAILSSDLYFSWDLLNEQILFEWGRRGTSTRLVHTEILQRVAERMRAPIDRWHYTASEAIYMAIILRHLMTREQYSELVDEILPGDLRENPRRALTQEEQNAVN